MAAPQKVDRYEILSKIAGGGMAVVYLARDPRVGRQVAVKVLHEHLAQDPQIRKRFKREAETIAALEHPAIVPLYDFGEEDESLYLVMRYMQGGTLLPRMKEGGMAVADIVPIMQRVGAALAEAHSQKIIHRDLKPGNILFDHTNHAYLSDFGIARLLKDKNPITKTGAQIIGTATYMSPEQVLGSEVDIRSDIYGLGVILFEMLTGKRPFTGDSDFAIAKARLENPPPYLQEIKPTLPEHWNWVVQKALAKDKTKRYQLVTELVADVEAVAAGRTPTVAIEPDPDATFVPADVTVVEKTRVVERALPKRSPKEWFWNPFNASPSLEVETGQTVHIKKRAGGEIKAEKKWINWRPIATIVGILLLAALAILMVNRRTDMAEPTQIPLVAAVATNTLTPTLTPTPSPTQTPTLTTTPTPSATASATHTATPPPTEAPTTTPTTVVEEAPQTATVLGPANVRSGPGTAYGIIASVRVDDTVTVLARDGSGEWLNVELADGTPGWLAARFVGPSSGTIPLAATIPATPRPTNTPIPTATPTLPPVSDNPPSGGGGGDNNHPPPPPPSPTWTPPPR